MLAMEISTMSIVTHAAMLKEEEEKEAIRGKLEEVLKMRLGSNLA